MQSLWRPWHDETWRNETRYSSRADPRLVDPATPPARREDGATAIMKCTFSPLLAALCAAASVCLTPVLAYARQDATEYAPRTPRKPRPAAQAAAASRTVTFAAVAGSDPAVKTATDATALEAIRKLMDTDGVIIGTVTDVFLPRSNNLVLLNFADDHRKAISIAVKSRNFGKFPDIRKLSGKRVLVTGRITEYRNNPQIEISKPEQLRIVQE